MSGEIVPSDRPTASKCWEARQIRRTERLHYAGQRRDSAAAVSVSAITASCARRAEESRRRRAGGGRTRRRRAWTSTSGRWGPSAVSVAVSAEGHGLYGREREETGGISRTGRSAAAARTGTGTRTHSQRRTQRSCQSEQEDAHTDGAVSIDDVRPKRERVVFRRRGPLARALLAYLWLGHAARGGR